MHFGFENCLSQKSRGHSKGYHVPASSCRSWCISFQYFLKNFRSYNGESCFIVQWLHCAIPSRTVGERINHLWSVHRMQILLLSVHTAMSSWNDIRESIPSKLPPAKDGSTRRRNRENDELCVFSQSLDLYFCREKFATYRPIQWPSAIVKNDAINPYRPARKGETPIAPPVERRTTY